MYFLQSHLQLYAYLKDDFRELYGTIKDRVKSGNWEPTGAMWLEIEISLAPYEIKTFHKSLF
ncbi:glycoside hydrolase family 38 N-terminal domain-containing protein [Paenibacillus vini]|uniref:glycoside hydrolase family 38 N-terminal domain-containing protein n=1 Tax=Paenibacillus TaxID=44249 RepID=UPI00338EEC7B